MDRNHKRWTGWTALALAGLTLLLYWPAGQYDFVQYDDPDYIFENPTVQAGLSWWGLAWSFVDAHVCNWHPITWLSHMLDCQLFGLHPGPPHLVSALLHAVNAALLLLLLARLTGCFWRSALAAALFAWHPLRVESVAWISERKDVLSGLFFLLTLWAYTRYVQTMEGGVGTRAEAPEATRRGRFKGFGSVSGRFYALAVFSFVLGLMSKAMLVTLPVILLLLDFWPLNRFSAKAAKEHETPGPRIWPLLTEKLPFFLAALAVGIITLLAQQSSGAMAPAGSRSLPVRCGDMLAGYFGYLEKLVWPHDLAVLYLRAPSPPLVEVVAGAAALAGLSFVTVVQWRRRPWLLVGWFWFVLMLLPVNGPVEAGLQSIADRYTYLPSIGLGLLAAWALPAKTGRWLQPVALLLLVACAALTRHQLRFWRNTETLMNQALAVDPANYVAHENLAVYFTHRGDWAAARYHRERGRELLPAAEAMALGPGQGTGSAAILAGPTPLSGVTAAGRK